MPKESIMKEGVILEESKEFASGEEAGYKGIDKLLKEVEVTEENIDELIERVHHPEFAPDIPKYILEGKEDQTDAYGMGFDYAVGLELRRKLESRPPAVGQAKSDPSSASDSLKILLAIGLPLLALYHLVKKAMNKYSQNT